ncbi:MAG: hypothetical protein J6R46_03370 [Clostridia bacterium]|nr:hypothetical protein [Clostridia bacterium]
MANKDVELKVNETAAVSDEELDSVSGGLGSAKIGGRAYNNLNMEKVRLVDGSRCPNCGSLVASVAFQKDDPSSVISNSAPVKCPKCNTVILKKVTPDAE